MDYKEEQQQEIEVLQSIYPDELSVESDCSYSILVVVDRQARPNRIRLDVKYPDTYPEVEPELRLEYVPVDEDDDDYDPDEEERIAHDDDTAFLGNTELSRLDREIRQVAAENIGMPSVFSVVSMLKDRAEEMCDEIVAQREKERLRRQMEEEQAEARRFQGTPVTWETFSKFLVGYRHALGRDIKPDIDHDKNLPPSGRQIFEQGLASEADPEDEL